MRAVLMSLAAAMALASPGPAQIMGSLLPDGAVSGLANTKAKGFEDYQGRLVLVEFFAYW